MTNALPAPGPIVPASMLAADSARRLVAVFLAGRSPETIRAYSADLDDFRSFAGAVDVDAAAAMLLGRGHGDGNALALAYRTHLQERRLAPTTINRRLAALRSLVKLARLLGIVPWALEVPGLRTSVLRDTRGPGAQGFRAMLSAARARSDAKGLRDAAMLALLFSLGLRRSEVVGLDLEHLDLAGGRVSILGKGRAQRDWLTLPAPARAALSAWVDARGGEPGPLFKTFDPVKARGARLTGRGLYSVVRAIGASAGLRVHPHGLRHAAITELLDAGEEIRTVQRFSRHRDLRVLMVYDDNRRDLGGEAAERLAARVYGESP